MVLVSGICQRLIYGVPPQGPPFGAQNGVVLRNRIMYTKKNTPAAL